MNEELVRLNEAFAVEQNKVKEVREQIDEFKDQMAAQNLEISRKIAEKEQKEAQVNYIFVKCVRDF